jgi:aspartyl-tRNA(Asn)/glutamyl-tRNA(Gln) amidotransferase subunit B
VESLRARLPELPNAKLNRFVKEFGLTHYDAARLTEEQEVARYFEQAAAAGAPDVKPKLIANWMLGDLFSLMNEANSARPGTVSIGNLKVQPEALAALARMEAAGQISQASGRRVLAEVFASGGAPAEIVERGGLAQVSDESLIAQLVRQSLEENPKEVASYRAGKTGVLNFLFGQVMRKAAGKANPQVVRAELERQLSQ